jgi:CyaY protein
MAQDVTFSILASKTLLLIANHIEMQDIDGLIDVDLQGDILTITNGAGIFIINKHSAAQQIWLASPISGPHHFSHIANHWISRTNVALFNILEQDLEMDFSQL